jgi:hypothetical protein
MLVVGEVRCRHTFVQSAPFQINGDFPLKVRCVDNWHRDSMVDIFEGADVEIFGTASSIDANSAGTCEAEVSCKSPKSARNFEGIVCEAN